MASIKNLFTPRGSKFYDLFEAAADNIIEMARLFQQLAHNKASVLPADVLGKIEDLEHQNDNLTHQIFIQLGRNFITPFDREDIHTLASALDDIADFTWGAARQMKNHHFAVPGDATTAFAMQHHANMKKMAEGVKELSNTAAFPSLALLLRDLRKNVQQSSRIVDDALVRVFSDGKDFKDVLKHIDHYELLHGILDKTATAMKTMEVIVVKYG